MRRNLLGNQEQLNETSPWQLAVSAIAGAIENGRLSADDLADLRRTVSVPNCSAFWHCLIRFVEPFHSSPAGDSARGGWERAWAVILRGMAHVSHVSDQSLGSALGQQGLSELRFRRLIRATGERLEDEFLTVCRFLAAKGAGFRWYDGAALILSNTFPRESWQQDVRRKISRDYFHTIFAKEKEKKGE